MSFQEQYALAQRRAELYVEQASLFERLATIDEELSQINGGAVTVTPPRKKTASAGSTKTSGTTATTSGTGKRRGRPPGTGKKQKAAAAAASNKPTDSESESDDSEFSSVNVGDSVALGDEEEIVVNSASPGRPPKGQIRVEAAGEDTPLPELIISIMSQVARPLKHRDIVTLVLSSGYQSDAKDKANMVYQCLRKLVTRGDLIKDEDQQYSFNSESVAA